MYAAGDLIANKFKVERTIGQGGMGVVYRAIETATNIPVAVKVINQTNVGSKKSVQRLLEEGVTARKISHPNVVSIYDIGLDGEQPYIAMEYIDGQPLHVWRGQKVAMNETVPVKLVEGIIKEILDGLEAAHSVGIVHRDLKPENIMLIGEPVIGNISLKIVDFGIALATKSQTNSSTGTGLGTQLYMAPEQIRNANAANESADLYSLSKIFYELIVGVLPTGHWQPPSDGRSDVLKGVDELIEKGLSVNRDLRPQNAAEYRQLLSNARKKKKFIIDRADDKEAKDLSKSYMAYLKSRPAWFWVLMATILGVIAFFPEEDTTDYDWHSKTEGTQETSDNLTELHNDVLDLIESDSDDADNVEESEKEPEKKPVKIVETVTPVKPEFDAAYFTGTWHDGLGGIYEVTTTGTGDFNGFGYLTDGTPANISGKISKREVAFSVVANGIQVGGGVSPRTDKCHFTYQIQNPYTGQIETQAFCMNHRPGAPCPA